MKNNNKFNLWFVFKNKIIILKKILKKYKGITIGGLFLSILFLSSLIIPWTKFNDYNPDKPNYPIREGISSKHWLGTDASGYDLFSRVLAGTKISLRISVLSILISASIGTFLGLISGYFRGFIDSIINFICDILIIFPDILLAIIIMLFLKRSEFTLIFILVITNLVTFIKGVRSNVLQIKQKDFIKASKALGSSDLKIIKKHILINIWPFLITKIVMGITINILVISGFGFIGLGLDQQIPEWGNILQSSRSDFRFYPHLFFGPFIIIFLTSFSLNLIIQDLVSYFNPKKN
ncbi:ABC transporter permease [Candidatus Phytoplasma pini]|uniref:Oligopeptide ABC Transporter Permease Protein n=1 Tax=Candidatus Phytoplasma pini TaxID=267362 RepID=A0A559KJ27_9MOLU|nr:ABC transporter permease [Candidatus Phytoplasma pini]TVY12143.1 Oligopeptide ABC Transporter Permease Protein [Candidatus Phytoplasma pini]